MDIRVGQSLKIRVLPKAEDSRRMVNHSVVRTEAAAELVIERIRPRLAWFYGLRRRFATISVLALTVWLLVHVMFGANGMMVYRQKREQVLNLQKEINSLQNENERYAKQIEDLKTDPKAIEKAAREQLHYTRPGEVVYVAPVAVVQGPPPTNSAAK